MELFKFAGDWETSLNLPYLTVNLDHPDLVGPNHGDDCLNGNLRMRICDSLDETPDPTSAQFAAIEFVQAHQAEILEAVFEYHKSVIYPLYETELGFSREESPEYYPAFGSVNDLKNVVAPIGLRIETYEKAGMAYYTFQFRWLLNEEDGLAISFYGLDIIDHGGLDMDETAIIADLGWNQFAYHALLADRKDRHEAAYISHIKNHGIYVPTKYDKLKPWQESANAAYPSHLVLENDFEAFKAFFQDEKNKAYWQVDQLLSLAVAFRKRPFIDFLLAKRPKKVYSALVNAIGHGDLDMMQSLLTFEQDINQWRGEDSYLFQLVQRLYEQYSCSENQAVYKKAIAHFMAHGANPLLKDETGYDVLSGFDWIYVEGPRKAAISNYMNMLCDKYCSGKCSIR